MFGAFSHVAVVTVIAARLALVVPIATMVAVVAMVLVRPACLSNIAGQGEIRQG